MLAPRVVRVCGADEEATLSALQADAEREALKKAARWAPRPRAASPDEMPGGVGGARLLQVKLYILA